MNATARPRLSSALCALLLLPALARARDLSFEERVAAQRAIEQVYWNHRIWPADNPGPKPPLAAVLSDTRIQAKVEDGLRMAKALAMLYGRTIGHDAIQAEIDRMARDTRDPATLRELFAALGDDPDRIAAALVRPRLVDAALRTAYANDARIHGELRQRAVSARAALSSADPLESLGGEYSETVYQRVAGDAGPSLAGDATIRLGTAAWNRMEAAVDVQLGARAGDVQAISDVVETADAFVVTAALERTASEVRVATVRWPKESFDHWWRRQGETIPSAPSAHDEAYALPVLPAGTPSVNSIDDVWNTTSTANVPDARFDHTAVWTGTEMIVWGGHFGGGGIMNTGGRYNPATDSWTATSTGLNCPAERFVHQAVWTGTKMIVWGGVVSGNTNTGGLYDPANDSWQPTSTGANVPLARQEFTAIWTGSVMIVWGGFTAYQVSTFTGARYNPNNDTWAATSTGLNVPSPRGLHTAVWTGSEMIVWGGQDNAGSGMNTGARYSPNSNGWTATSATGNVPSARFEHTAVWTGSEMIVWGGNPGGLPSDDVNTGARYSPGTNFWTPISTGTNVPEPRVIPSAVWTGSEMIVWGGNSPHGDVNSGGRYDPFFDRWAAASMTGVPSAREEHTAVWTGTQMIVWGGFEGFDALNTGGLYRTCYNGQILYRDADGDGYGDAAMATTCGSAGPPPPGYATTGGDCNDADPNVHPGATEVMCNGVDDNCDGQVDEVAPVAFAAHALHGTTSPSAVVIGDVNFDGKKDVIAASSASNNIAVYRGDGYGGFAAPTVYATGNGPRGLALADLNGDGRQDVVTANSSSNTVSVLLSDGVGGFGAKADFATAAAPYAVAVGDLNGDGRPDLAVADYTASKVSVLLGTGSGGFGAKTDFATGTNPGAIAIADLNGDGKADIATADQAANAVSVLLGNGAGSFAANTDYPVGVNPSGLAVADLNSDGLRDLVTANSVSGTVSVLLAGGGAYAKTDFATGAGPSAVKIADVDGDGKVDLVVTNANANTVSWLPGNGAGGFGARIDFSTGSSPAAVAVGDVSLDGKPDLVVADNGSNTVSVLLGNATQLWGSVNTYAVGTNPHAVAAGDLNGDGKRDLAVANLSTNTVSILLGTGDGHFVAGTDVPTGDHPRSVVLRDFNGDGKLDMAVANYASNTISVMLGNGAGGFGAKTDYPTGSSPYMLAAADLNKDGKLDLVTNDVAASTISVLLGNGSGGFGAKTDFVTGTNPYSLIVADLNGDGTLDVATADYTMGTVTVLIGDGAGAFFAGTNFPAGDKPFGIAAADLNGDGLLDLVACNLVANTVSVLLNSGGGVFGSATPYGVGGNPYALIAGDVNGDGRADLVAANATANTVTVLFNPGDGTLGGRADICTGGQRPLGLALADVNGDGRLDLASANFISNTVTVLLNAYALVGVDPGRAALPAPIFALLPPRPNPSPGRTEFAFTLPQAARVTIDVFDVSGRHVAQLARGERFVAGPHAVAWDGRGASGAQVPSGVYMARILTGSNEAARKFVVVTR